jgi:hypothetical protein
MKRTGVTGNRTDSGFEGVTTYYLDDIFVSWTAAGKAASTD